MGVSACRRIGVGKWRRFGGSRQTMCNAPSALQKATVASKNRIDEWNRPLRRHADTPIRLFPLALLILSSLCGLLKPPACHE